MQDPFRGLLKSRFPFTVNRDEKSSWGTRFWGHMALHYYPVIWSYYSKKQEITDYITSPFPYAYATPHVGNLYQIVRCSLMKDLRNCYYKSGLYDHKTYFSYNGLHLTGLPIYLKLEEMNELLDQGVPISEVLRKHNLSYLVDFVTPTTKKLTLHLWYHVMRQYYKTILKTLDVDNRLPEDRLWPFYRLWGSNNWYGTTDVDRAYHEFVNRTFLHLKEMNLLVEGLNCVLYCDQCENIVGDHDRKNFEGFGVHSVKIRTCWTNGRHSYYYTDRTEPFVVLSEECRVSMILLREIFNNLPKNTTAVLHLAEDQVYRIHPEILESFASSEELGDSEPELIIDGHYAVGDVRCRCNSTATIKTERTMFIDFRNPKWAGAVKQRIDGSENDRYTKDELLRAADELRPVAFLRTRGFGSRLTIFRNSRYENHMVDSLTDSTLFAYYSANRDLLNPRLRLGKKNHHVAHFSGKDLLKNHILYFYYFSVLLTPKMHVPLMITDGHIVDENNVKMSKSLNNVITYEDLKDRDLANRSTLITCFTNMSDSREDKKLVLSNLTALNHAEKKRSNEIRTLLSKIPESVLAKSDILLAIVHLISRELDLVLEDYQYQQAYFRTHTLFEKNSSGQKFRLRYIKHLMHHYCHKQLKRLKQQISTSPVTGSSKWFLNVKLKFELWNISSNTVKQVLYNLSSSLV